MDDFYQLTDRQRDMVFQFMEMMSNNSIEVAQAILTVNGWDLQVRSFVIPESYIGLSF